jgi:hypothetical protein
MLSWVLFPAQMVADPSMVAVGSGFTVTVAVAVPLLEQVFASETLVTEYDVVFEGLTVKV